MYVDLESRVDAVAVGVDFIVLHTVAFGVVAAPCLGVFAIHVVLSPGGGTLALFVPHLGHHVSQGGGQDGVVGICLQLAEAHGCIGCIERRAGGVGEDGGKAGLEVCNLCVREDKIIDGCPVGFNCICGEVHLGDGPVGGLSIHAPTHDVLGTITVHLVPVVISVIQTQGVVGSAYGAEVEVGVVVGGAFNKFPLRASSRALQVAAVTETAEAIAGHAAAIVGHFSHIPQL